ncbi:MAG: large-conductance mechanosensitive channel protein MscL [Bacteroidales bacterium]|nr:large-conductance mechanosensitive channel protein MscL [Bacteroidales bacterium]
MGKTLEEFKNFALKGNVVDMAVGVIIGAAFGKIVTSLVNDVIMPVLGFIIGGVNFSELKWVMKAGSEGVDPVTLNYGNFIQVTIDFLIVALTLFFILKAFTKMASFRKKSEAKADAAK